MLIKVKKETTLQDYLIQRGFRKNRIKKLLKFGCISVNGEIIKRYDHPLSEGDRILIRRREGVAEDILKRTGIKVIYEDNDLIVIDKPSGLLSISTETEKRRTAYFILNEYLKTKDERVFIVHRLDRDTSGVMVFAKTEEAKRRLQESWGSTEKVYLAVVEGIPKKKEGFIKSYLKETKTLLVYNSRERDSKPSVTAYRVLTSEGGYCLLECRLITGRKNQIRVHLSSIGHPVAGDKKYGARTDPAGRLLLHSWRLTFNHPSTGERLTFTSPPRFRPFI